MIDTNTIFAIFDTILITPYRIPVPSVAAFWFGTAVFALWCTVAGEISMALVYLWNRKYYTDLNQKMTRMHNISVEAIRRHNKKVFKSANDWANEYFGKVFFSHAALFAVSLWPVAFALGWLQERFGGISVHTIPYFDFGLGYPFVFILSYIVVRYSFSKIRKFIPFLCKVDVLREEDALSAGEMTSWTELAPEFKKKTSPKKDCQISQCPAENNS
ncbi:hypothetical protein SAMN05660337_1969 [Maridesulfovibrio ferrireducens]|uniref:Uncharacterized protein n=1 Tax=Maridesulfovibrio ferrireducens TaxID=246191 RepID=A0A1G9H1U5_9BACT|nr:hypothetical protein [Maridesulfovibrio ferrireducens]SDL06839.1 hypothetical protein SAMN05660337_1969 [Maridesulfovibrio ferrireducens]